MRDPEGLNGWHVAPPRSQAAPSSRAPRWIVPPKDPLHRVFELDGDKAVRVLAFAAIFTVALHGAAAVRTAYIHAEMITWTMQLDAYLDKKLKLTQQVDIETMRPPDPRPIEKVVEPPPEKVESKQAAPAAAAQAAQVLAAKPDDVLNFGDNVFVVGKSEKYVGGTTKTNGTNDKPPATQHVADHGTGNGLAQAAQITSVDLSRTAELAGSGEWRCPFPPEADADQVDEAAAVIEVVVGSDGRPARAAILQDPGHGFGREARACAMRESYVPALDRDGRAVTSSKKFRVKFER